jgi:hypothetical protein
MDKDDVALVSQLERVIQAQWRTMPAIAEDLEAVVKFARAKPEDRDTFDPALTTRLQALIDSLVAQGDKGPLAGQMMAALELVRKIKSTEG